ncbi:MAG: ABC transporter permease [Cyanobacteriota bacterium]|jgi:nitrate/nitrite transport system permease protein
MLENRLSKPLAIAISCLSIFLALVFWQILASQGVLGKNFPGSITTLQGLVWWLSDPFFNNGPNDLGIGTNLLISLRRVLIGYGLAVVVAVPLGLFVGISRIAESTVNPFVQLLKPVSPLAWLPIGLFTFRDSEMTGVFVIFISSVWPTLINTAFGVSSINPDFLRVSRSLGASQLRTVVKVVLPAVMPNILAGMRISMGTAWLVIVAAEMLLGSGIGYFIWNEWNNLSLPNIFAAIIVIGFAGLLLDQVFGLLQKRFDYQS